jgi:hypothetical protein
MYQHRQSNSISPKLQDIQIALQHSGHVPLDFRQFRLKHIRLKHIPDYFTNLNEVQVSPLAAVVTVLINSTDRVL